MTAAKVVVCDENRKKGKLFKLHICRGDGWPPPASRPSPPFSGPIVIICNDSNQ